MSPSNLIHRPRLGRSGRLTVLFLLLALAGAVMRPLAEPDEGRYGEAAREMAASGDWLLPRQSGLVYPDKPPGAYWLMAAAVRLFGAGAPCLRWHAWAALCATVWLVRRAGRRFGSGERGDCAALLLAANPLLLALGQLATLDALLTACVTLGILAARAWMEHGKIRNAWLAGAAWGAAFLVKGPVGWALPLAVLAATAAWERQPRRLLRLLHPALLLPMLVVSLSWYLLAWRAEPALLDFWIGRETLGRLASDVHGRGQPWWYFPGLAAAIHLPWIAGFLLLRRRRPAPTAPPPTPTPAAATAPSPADRLPLVWAVLPVLLFSLPQGKQPAYLAPALPGFALWLSGFWSRPELRRPLLAAGTGMLVLSFGLLLWHLDPLRGRSDDPIAAVLKREGAQDWRGAQLFGWSYGLSFRLERTDLQCFGPPPKAWHYAEAKGEVVAEPGRRKNRRRARELLAGAAPAFLLVHEPWGGERNLLALERFLAAAPAVPYWIWLRHGEKSLVANRPPPRL